jgi:hypothetical protein
MAVTTVIATATVTSAMVTVAMMTDSNSDSGGANAMAAQKTTIN